MSFRRRHRILAAGKSPSTEAMKRTYARAILNGGVTQDFSTNVENIRELSRKVGYNVLQDANFLYVPSSYGESKNFVQNPSLRNLIRESESLVYNTGYGFWVISNGASIVSSGNIDPLGNNTAKEINCTLLASLANFQINPTSGIAGSSNTYTASVWLKGKVGGEQVQINLYQYNVLDHYSPTITLTTNWVRYTWSVTMAANINPPGFAVKNATGSTTNFYMWGVQLEKSPIVTPYQRTTDGIADFTSTRATTSTVTNKQGVIEDSCYNLLQRSEEFDNAYWNKTNVTITANIIAAPNGTLTADKLVETVVGGFHSLTTSNSIVGQVYNFSVYAKVGGRSYMQLQLGSSGVLFNLTNGTIQATSGPVTGVVSSLGDGWYLCSVSGNTVTNGSNNILLFDNTLSPTYPGDGVSGVYIWGAQLTQGSTPRPYLRTTNRLNVPKLDYSRSSKNTLNPNNKLKSTENFTDASWVKFQSSTITPNVIANPLDGATNASMLSVASLSASGLYQDTSKVNEGVITTSIFAKAGTLSYLSFVDVSGGAFKAWFNLTTGTVGTVVAGYTANIVSYGNGWYRCSLTHPAQTNNYFQIGATNTDNTTPTTGNIYIYGAQSELGSIATPYKIADEPSLLIERQSTILCLRSAEFNSWIKEGDITIVSDTIVSPDGTLTADKLVEGTTSTGRDIYFGSLPAVTANTAITYSIYLKAGERTKAVVFLGGDGGSNIFKANFDLTTRTMISSSILGDGTFISSSIQDAGNGWSRYSITGKFTASRAPIPLIGPLDNSGNVA